MSLDPRLPELLTAPTLIEWRQAALPARLNGLYYLWRPLRLAGKYLKPASRCRE